MAVSNALKAENNEIKMIWLKLAKQKEEERKQTIKEKKTLNRRMSDDGYVSH
jgi:hypothetical protein